jgi:hypothetical protein
MRLTVALLLMTYLQQPVCKPNQVLSVERGGDCTLNICGIGVVALRGVEPPLKVARGFPLTNLGGETPQPGPVAGEVLGQPDRGPEGIAFLSNMVAGKAVKVEFDGFRIGDPGGRGYAYVYLPDNTLLNGELIRRGYAYADRQGSHPRRDEFIALEESARRKQLGVWMP